MSRSKASTLVASDPLFSQKPPMEIKDGKGAGSLSLRHMITQEMSLLANTGSTKPWDVLIFAGYNNNVRMAYSSGTKDGSGFVGSGRFFEYDTCPVFTDNGDFKYQQQDVAESANGLSGNRLTHWRTVAAGARFSLTNNQAEDDGWFEAARIKADWLGRQHVFGRVEANTTASGTPLVAGGFNDKDQLRNHFFVDYSEDIAGLPSYVSGKLRDIHHHSFRLKRTSREHPFIGFAKTGTTAVTEVNTYNAEKAQGIPPFVDPTFDAILLRIHPREVEPLSKIMIHAVQTCQYFFDEKSIFNQAALQLRAQSRGTTRKRKPMKKRRKVVKRRRRTYKK